MTTAHPHCTAGDGTSGLQVPVERKDTGDSKQRLLLFVINDIGFFLSHRLPIARAAQVQGFNVHVAGQGTAASAELVALGFSTHELSLSRGMRGGVRESVLALRQCYALFRRLRPDVVHAVTLKPVIIAGAAARLARVRSIVHALTGLGFAFTSTTLKGRLLKRLAILPLRYALTYPHARTIVQNPDDLKAVTEVAGVASQQICLIKGSGVDCERFRPTPEPPGPPLIVLAGRMLWDKGIAEFVEAAQLLRKQGVIARFALVGIGDSFNPANVPEEQLEAWQSAGAIEYWGQRYDMDKVLAAAHVVCLPSYREGLPKVLIEAAASGRPIVTTDAPGCREIGRQNENALLVPVRDAAKLAEALRRLIADPALRVRLGARGREIALSEFSEQHVVKRTLELYNTLTDCVRPFV